MTQGTTLHFGYVSSFFSSLWQFTFLLLLLITLTVLSSTGQVTYKTSPKLGLSVFVFSFFSWLGWGYGFLEKLL